MSITTLSLETTWSMKDPSVVIFCRVPNTSGRMPYGSRKPTIPMPFIIAFYSTISVRRVSVRR